MSRPTLELTAGAAAGGVGEGWAAVGADVVAGAGIVLVSAWPAFWVDFGLHAMIKNSVAINDLVIKFIRFKFIKIEMVI